MAENKDRYDRTGKGDGKLLAFSKKSFESDEVIDKELAEREEQGEVEGEESGEAQEEGMEEGRYEAGEEEEDNDEEGDDDSDEKCGGGLGEEVDSIDDGDPDGEVLGGGFDGATQVDAHISRVLWLPFSPRNNCRSFWNPRKVRGLLGPNKVRTIDSQANESLLER